MMFHISNSNLFWNTERSISRRINNEGLYANAGGIDEDFSCRGLDAQSFRPDFMSFGHRGQLMPLNLEPLPLRA